MPAPLNLKATAPWRRRFRAPDIAWTSLATQNPARGLVCTNHKSPDGTYQLYAWDVATGQLTRRTKPTEEADSVRMGAISADGAWIYYLHASQGREIGHFYRVSFDTGEAYILTPDWPAYTSFYITESFSGQYLGFMTANQYGFKMFVMDRDGGSAHLRYENEAFSVGPLLSYNGEMTVAAFARPNTFDFILEAYDTLKGERLHVLDDGPGTTLNAVGFAQRPGDMRLIAMSNRHGLNRPLIWNTRTGERRDLPLNELPGEVSVWDWSPDGALLLLKHTHRAEERLYLYDLNADALRALDHPPGSFGDPGYFAPNGNLYVHWQDASQPNHLLEIDAETGQPVRAVLRADEVPAGTPWRSVTFASDDGTEVQAWLGVPESAPGPVPTLVHVHGGPTDLQFARFSPEFQAWLDHGFAVFSINYRGSVTFGKAFERAIIGNIGHYELMDIDAGTRWLVAEGIAQPDALFLMGQAYGGFLTLLALAKLPERFAGGLATAAIADWRMHYDDEDEMLRAYQRSLFGGEPDEKPDAYREASPLTHVDAIRAPLLLFHNRDDPRYPSRPIEAFVAALEARQHPVTLEWYDPQTAFTPETRMRQQTHQMQFVYEHLK